MNIEQWKFINGFEGRYSISNYGNIKQNDFSYINQQGHFLHFDEKILKPFTWQSRYLRIDISHRGKRLSTYVHKLVAEHFIGERPEGYVIDHIDGNYLNNHADNLRYVTPKENVNNIATKYRIKEGLHKLWDDPIKRKEYSDKISKGTKIGMKNSNAGVKISNINKGRKPMFKDNEYKRIKPDEIDLYLKNGWSLGFPEYIINKLKRKKSPKKYLENF